MPRLTDKHYLEQRQLLVKAWQKDRLAFLLLPWDQQLDLHGFYAPYKQFTDDEAIEHRRQVTADHPNLPARAGKIFKKISGLIRPDGTITYLRRRHHGNQRYRISALARPEIDVEKLARVLLEVAEARRSRTEHSEEAA